MCLLVNKYLYVQAGQCNNQPVGVLVTHSNGWEGEFRYVFVPDLHTTGIGVEKLQLLLDKDAEQYDRRQPGDQPQQAALQRATVLYDILDAVECGCLGEFLHDSPHCSRLPRC